MSPRKRSKPYTTRGIQRVPCHRVGCGRPGYSQWNACAENHNDTAVYRVVCAQCDVELNEIAMRWMYGPDNPHVEQLLADYREKVLGDGAS